MKRVTELLIPMWAIFLFGVASHGLPAEALSPRMAIAKCGKNIPYDAMRPNDLGPKTIAYRTSPD